MWNYDYEAMQKKLYEYFFQWPEAQKTRKAGATRGTTLNIDDGSQGEEGMSHMNEAETKAEKTKL
jgi:hypothetical protein